MLEPWLGAGRPATCRYRASSTFASMPRHRPISPRSPTPSRAGATLDTHRQWRTELRRGAGHHFLAYGILPPSPPTIAIRPCDARRAFGEPRGRGSPAPDRRARQIYRRRVQRHFHLGFRGGDRAGAFGRDLSGAQADRQRRRTVHGPDIGSPAEHYPALAAVPFAAAAVAVATARITVMRSLERML